MPAPGSFSSTLRRRVLPGACALLCVSGCFGQGELDVQAPDAPAAPKVEAAQADLACTDGPPPATPTRLLTRAEYDNTVRDLLGDDSRPAQAFPKEPRVLGFENNTSAHQVNPLLVSAYLEAAETLAQRALSTHREQLVPCDPSQVGAQMCGRAFLEAFVPRAYRRPPTPQELAALTRFFDQALQTQGFDGAVEWTLQVILQSPQFLYRVEAGTPAPDGTYRLGAYEVASRLSYFLWGTLPDDALLDAAANGQLDTDEGVAAQARRMLADPRAEDALQSFFRQWLHLDGLDALEKNATAHPEFTQDVPAAWRRGLELFVKDAFWNGAGNTGALFGSRALYLNDVTAPLYGVAAPAPGDFVRVEGPANERAGLFTQPGLMALLAGPFDSSPVKRGVFIREKLFCQQLPSPPGGVAITPPEPDPNATTRERFSAHTQDATCAACHTLIDPVGFGFEHYDALGRFRWMENGKTVDASGEVTGVLDDALLGPFDGAVELSARLSHSAQVKDCIATQWFRFAAGRLEADADGCTLKEIRERFLQTNGDFRELLVAITQTRAFRYRAAPEVTP